MYCPSCMRYNNDENAVRCEYCNEPMNLQNNTFQLPVGTILAGRYYVGKVLGQGGFGITYIGCDLKLNMKMAIKEYYPQGLIGRVSKYDLKLTVNSGNQHTVYEIQKDRFMKEARILAEFASDSRIVRVTDIFEENNTAYIVMDYVEGITLEKYCKQYGRMTFDAIWDMLQPITETLGKIHDRGLIHRDISPSNIMLNDSTGVKLIDFGSARDYSETDDKSLSVVLKPGYAPPEQYSSRGQGPWTDVYALCTTMYRAITGVVPMNSIERITNYSLKHPSDMGAVIKPEQEAVLMSGLAVKKEDRIQSMRELDEAINMANNGAVAERAKKYFKATIPLSTNEHKNKFDSISSSNSTDKEVSNSKQNSQKTAEPNIAKLNARESENKNRNTKEKNKTEYNKQDNIRKKNKKSIVVGIVIIAATVCVVVTFTVLTVVIPSKKYETAILLMENAKYEDAINIFDRLNGYKDSTENIEKCKEQKIDTEYTSALSLMNKGEHEKVIDIFQSLDGYKDSKERIEECQEILRDVQYKKALSLMNDKKYDDAISIFESLDGYKYSNGKIEKCKEAIKNNTEYLNAVALMNKGKYEQAIAAFESLNGYEDTKEKIVECKKKKINTADVGDEIDFGLYEQDGNLINGMEPIKWIVLKKENGKTLVISKFGLDCVPYYDLNKNVNWDNSDLRKILNRDFVESAFDPVEEKWITKTVVRADDNPKYNTDPGMNTLDKIFLLSTDEAEQLFSSVQERQCSPTKYAKKQGAFTGNNGNGWWFLRTPGNSNNRVAYVNTGGIVDYKGTSVEKNNTCMRPAMWINLDS